MAGENYYHIVAACVLVVLSPLMMVQGQTLGLLLPTRVCCTPTGACPVGAAGLANVTGILSCVNPLTGILSEVGRGISTANGTLIVTVSPMPLVGSVLTNVVNGGIVPCVLAQTLQLVNQVTCPVLNVANTTLVAVTKLASATANSALGLVIGVLNVTNSLNVAANVGVGVGV